MLKLLNSQSKSITGAALIIAGATLINKFVGILRDRTIAHYFGAGPVTDAYYAAFKIPDLVYGLLVVGALTAGFIPTFIKLFNKGEDKSPAWKLTNNVINILGVCLAALCGLGMIFAAPAAKLIAPGFADDGLRMVAVFTRVMFLSPFILGLSMALGGVLQSLRRFVLYSIAPIFYNLGIIAGAVWLTPLWGPTGLAWGVALGAFLHLLIQLYGAWQAGWRWQWSFSPSDPDTRLIGRLMLPRTLGLAVSNVNTIVITMLASLLPAGAVASYNFADNLQWVPIGVIGISFALAVFPILSAAATENDKEKFIKNLAGTGRQILFLVIPVSIIFLLLRAQIVRVVLGSGAFNWTATINTANALAFFSLGLFAQALIPLLARAFFALSDTKTPFMVGVASGLVNIAAAWFLMKELGVAGLALAASLGAVVNCALLAVLLKRAIGHLEGAKLLAAIYRISAAGLLMGVTIQTLKYPLAKILNQDYFWGIFGQGAIAGLAGLGIYGIVCYILKLEEMNLFINSLRRKWLKWRNVQTTELLEAKE